jgi:hypothetical protein
MPLFIETPTTPLHLSIGVELFRSTEPLLSDAMKPKQPTFLDASSTGMVDEKVASDLTKI